MQTSKCLRLLFTLFMPLASIAQEKVSLDDKDITGLWKGTLYNDSTQKYYRYEIGISEEKGKLSGFSHTFFLDGDKEFYGVKKVKVKKMDGKLIIEDAGLIANNYPVAPAKGVRQLNILTFETTDSMMVLSGPFTTNRTKTYSPLTGFVKLQRKDDFWQSALVPHLQELGKADELSFVQAEKEKIKGLLAKNEQAEKPVTQPGKGKEDADKEKEDPDKKKEEPEKEEPAKPVIAATEPAPGEAPVMFAPKAADKPKPVENKAAPENKPKQENKQKPENKKQQPEKATEPVKAATKPVEEAAPVIPPAADVLKRTTVLQQTVYFSSDSLEITLYDNGEVDGDIVSVLMNGKLIMEKEKLSTKAVKKMIYAEPGEADIELVMYAENLGAIAPNTGLLVVHDGKSIYEVRFSGDLQKNASIILKRKK